MEKITTISDSSPTDETEFFTGQPPQYQQIHSQPTGLSESSKETSKPEKLQFLKSPVSTTVEIVSLPHPNGSPYDTPDFGLFGDRFTNDSPQFQKHESENLLELFYDLLFAANFSIFSENQGLNSSNRVKAYVGYFGILWLTWLLVTVYDVRFVTDSVFERVCRAIHFAIMIGFSVVAHEFKPYNQDADIMRTMSYILSVSRLILAIEYSSILWHIRHYKKCRSAMLLQIGMNLIAALLYFAISFRFRSGNSLVYIAWYIIGVSELILTFVFAANFEVLSLEGTHLMERMSTMTIFFLGEGVVLMAQNVVTIVKGPGSWDSLTIGTVTTTAAIIYCIFLTYFDWMKTTELSKYRQQAWTILHFVFHLSLVLFILGITQFLLWSKILDLIDKVPIYSIFNDPAALSKSSSEAIAKNLTGVIYDFYRQYPPKNYTTWETANWALGEINKLPDNIWPEIAKNLQSFQDLESKPNVPHFDELLGYIYTLVATMQNTFMQSYGIDVTGNVEDENPTASTVDFEFDVIKEAWHNFELMFNYGHIAGGVTLLTMCLLTIIARTKPWTKWSILRTGIFIALSIALALLSLLSLNSTYADRYQQSPMLLPTIGIIWFIVLVLTHFRNPSPLLFSRRRSLFSRNRYSYDSVD